MQSMEAAYEKLIRNLEINPRQMNELNGLQSYLHTEHPEKIVVIVRKKLNRLIKWYLTDKKLKLTP